MRAWGSRYARLVLERCDNNKRKACRVLDISYHTLQAYLRYTPQLRATQRALPPATRDVAESDAGSTNMDARILAEDAVVPIVQSIIVAE